MIKKQRFSHTASRSIFAARLHGCGQHFSAVLAAIKHCLLHVLTRSGKGFILEAPIVDDLAAVKRHGICLYQWHILHILDKERRETLMLHTVVSTIDDLMSLCQR